MKKQYYVTSTKQGAPRPRQTKTRGTVFDATVRVYTTDGKPVQKKFSGYKTKTLLKEAITEFFTNECEYVKYLPTALALPTQDKDLLKIKDLVPIYLSRQGNQIKDATIYEKQKIFDLLIIPYFGETSLYDLSLPLLKQWQETLWGMKNPKTGEYYSYKYLSKIRSYFSAFLTWCSEHYGMHNYLLDFRKPKNLVGNKKMLYWTPDEFARFIAQVDDAMYKAFFSMLFYAGMRKGETLALSPADVENDVIHIDKSLTRKTIDNATFKITSTKASKVRQTPICEPLKKILSEYSCAPDKRFFFGGDTPLTDNTLRRAFNQYAKQANVKQIRIHDLRHSFVSMLVHLGANLAVIAELIGDTLEQVTKTYAHFYENDKIAIMQKIK